MNRIHTTVAIAGLCAMIVGLQAWRGSDSQTALPNSNPVSSDQTPSAPSIPSGSALGDPANLNATQEHANALPSQETEMVAGFQVRKNRDCDVRIHYIPDAESAEVHEIMSCEPHNPDAPHPYETWSNELLAQEAYADAKAAEILALRHIPSEDPALESFGLNLLYRSVALSGDPEVFRRAISMRYAHVSENGKPDIDNLKQLLVFSHIGDALGIEIFDAGMIASDLKGHDVTAEEVSRLRSASRQILEQMASLQTEITGATSIREALKNA